MPVAFGKLRVIPGEDPPELELVEVLVADIQGSQASQLVRVLSSTAALGELDHLKRVRKLVANGTSQLQIVLCRAQPANSPQACAYPSDTSSQAPTAATTADTARAASKQAVPSAAHVDLEPTLPQAAAVTPARPSPHVSISMSEATATTAAADTSQLPFGPLGATAEEQLHAGHTVRPQTTGSTADESFGDMVVVAGRALPPAVAALVLEHQLHVHVVQAPRHAPSNREQWKEWNQIWPISWRKPELTAVTAASAAALAITEAEEQMARQWMAQAHGLAEENSDGGGVCNAAVIVDPTTGTVIAEGQDCTSHHPLQHAVMVAIEAAAARDRRIWPAKLSAAPSTACNTAHSTAPSTAMQPAEHVLHGANKRQRMAEEASADALSAQSTVTSLLTTDPADPDHEPAAGTATVPHIGNNQESSVSSIDPPKSYLCTGFDCYMVQEPCAMCAMAATHARIRRMTYFVADKLHGALGGAFKLHGQRSLNHHYQVFQLPAD